MEDGRCKTFTKNGERCKNSARAGDCCFTHRGQEQESKIDKLPIYSMALSAASTVVILIEKAAEYYPEIVGWLSMIDASTKHASAQPRPLNSLRQDLDQGELWSVSSYGHILTSSLTGNLYQPRPKQIESLPDELKEEFVQAYETFKNAQAANGREVYKQNERFEEAMSSLLKWIWLIKEINPSIYDDLVDVFIYESESWDKSWWDIAELKKYKWRIIVVAEHLLSSIGSIRPRIEDALRGEFAENALSSIRRCCEDLISAEYELRRLGSQA